MCLRANWKDHKEIIQKSGLVIHPFSKECQTIWNNIQNDCHFQSIDSAISVPVKACEDDIFDEQSPSYRKFDSVIF